MCGNHDMDAFPAPPPFFPLFILSLNFSLSCNFNLIFLKFVYEKTVADMVSTMAYTYNAKHMLNHNRDPLCCDFDITVEMSCMKVKEDGSKWRVRQEKKQLFLRGAS